MSYLACLLRVFETQKVSNMIVSLVSARKSRRSIGFSEGFSSSRALHKAAKEVALAFLSEGYKTGVETFNRVTPSVLLKPLTTHKQASMLQSFLSEIALCVFVRSRDRNGISKSFDQKELWQDLERLAYFLSYTLSFCKKISLSEIPANQNRFANDLVLLRQAEQVYRSLVDEESYRASRLWPELNIQVAEFCKKELVSRVLPAARIYEFSRFKPAPVVVYALQGRFILRLPRGARETEMFTVVKQSRSSCSSTLVILPFMLAGDIKCEGPIETVDPNVLSDLTVANAAAALHAEQEHLTFSQCVDIVRRL